MDPSIRTILTRTYTEEVYRTHVSMITPKGSYLFNRQILEELWKNYCDEISNENYKYGIAEIPQQQVPILADIDLKIDVEEIEEERLYTYEVVEKVISIYQKVIREIIDDIEDANLTCVLLEKPAYKLSTNTKTLLKNGFHLHFPEIFLDKADQEVHFIPRIIQEMKAANVFAYLGIEDSGIAVDKQCCTNPWLLYGSKKEDAANPYLFSKVYNHNLKEISLEEAFRHYLIYDNRGVAISGFRNKIKYYLPRILSILPANRDCKTIKPGLVPILQAKTTKVKEQRKYDKISVEENLKIAKRILPLLSSERAENYTEWMTVGWVLYNISEASEEGLKLWLEFSSRCGEKFDSTKCHYQWTKMHQTDMTIGTLKYYASIDSPEKYKEFKKDTNEKLVQESILGSHNDIAKILYSEYGNEFVCASVSGKTWYQFIGHRWECIEEGVFLREKISSVVVNMFKDMRKKIYADEDKGEEEADENKMQERSKQITKVIKELKNANFKDNVMKEAREVFYDKRFRDKLDNNPYIIAFKNGVFDLKEDIFRNGRPEDFVSKSMPINFVQFDDKDEKVLQVHDFLMKVFPDNSIRTFFLDTSSEIFIGGNHRKIFQMWTGDGDNGKSVTQMFFEYMLGSSLSIKIPTTLVCSKKPLSGAAWPELARAGGGVRAAWIEEIDESEEMYSGIVKHLTGNDSFVARDLFEKGKDMKEIKPMFKLFFICNKPVNFVGGGDQALWNRARVIPFESTFCRENNPAPESFEEQLQQKRFPMDREFAQKIPGLVEAFAWVLLQHRTKPKMMVEPEKVRSATNAYRQRNDIYRQFIEECIVEDVKAKLHLNELYARFKEWYRDSMGGTKNIPIKDHIKQYFVKAWGDMESAMKWSGYKIRSLSDDIEAGEAIVMDEDDLVDYGKPPM